MTIARMFAMMLLFMVRILRLGMSIWMRRVIFVNEDRNTVVRVVVTWAKYWDYCGLCWRDWGNDRNCWSRIVILILILHYLLPIVIVIHNIRDQGSTGEQGLEGEFWFLFRSEFLFC